MSDAEDRPCPTGYKQRQPGAERESRAAEESSAECASSLHRDEADETDGIDRALDSRAGQAEGLHGRHGVPPQALFHRAAELPNGEIGTFRLSQLNRKVSSRDRSAR